MGKIEEIYRGTGDKIVVLIQDAHSIPDAQQVSSLPLIIFRHNTASLVGLEGASKSWTRKSSGVFRIKNSSARHSMLTVKGELTGAQPRHYSIHPRAYYA